MGEEPTQPMMTVVFRNFPSLPEPVLSPPPPPFSGKRSRKTPKKAKKR